MTKPNLRYLYAALAIALLSASFYRPEPSAAMPDPLSSTSTYYSVRSDLRRCASPRCGGYFVKRVNLFLTRCADGHAATECYVAEIDWGAQPQAEIPGALLRGNVVPKFYPRFGNLGAFRVSESWQAASNNQPTGTHYRVRDRGLRCITYPCLTHHEAKLNSIVHANIAGVDLNGTGATEELVGEASRVMTEPDGVLVAGSHEPVRGPGGRSRQLKASQFYLRTRARNPTSKACFKTGCSNQVCADENVITTCEWRPEYACYQKARCERQSNGKCGFTRTPELIACLEQKE
ncbi:MAG TPA: DUF6748 domain-containing protein [Pyrinomonadaceae bacterium]|nr:DUF6748 domain-containing protein [Pyrinomonadaceae bacterium]